MRSLFFIPIFVACTSEKSITTVNKAPKATITSHSDGDEVLEGYAITLRGSASDSNNTYDELTAIWYGGTEVICEAAVPQSDGTTECEVVITADDSEFTLEVKDDQNATDSASATVTVVATESPEALILSPTADGVYYSDQLMTFSGILSDGEDDSDVLIGYWESNVDGVLEAVDVEPNTDGETEGFGLLTEGQHAIQLHVEDSTGKTGSESVIINVGPPNSSPLCAVTSPVTGTASAEGENIDFMALVSDVDVPSNILEVSWESDKDGLLGSSTPNSQGDVLFSWSALTVNTHTITMTVSDEVGANCTDFISYAVGTPPSVSIDSPVASESYDQGSTISFSAIVSDAQDQANELSLNWDLDGASLSSQGATSTGTAQFTDSSLAYGSHTLTVTATDTDGLTADDIVTFTVNGLPTQPSVVVSPDPATTSNDLTASASGSIDPDGSPVSYSYDWHLNGSSTGNTGAVLAASLTSKGETWTVYATPNDGTSDGIVGSVSVMISNTAPTLSAVLISPAAPIYNDDIVTCSVTVTDPDEMVTPSYEWTIIGSVVGVSAALDLSSTAASPTDTVLCTATATDSDGETATGSASVTIDNRTPVVNAVVITPSTLYSNSMATCGFSASDPDGDSLTNTVEWVTNGTSVIGNGATFQLSSAIVIPGDILGCRATSSDGLLSDTKTGTTVTISNTDPILSVSITSMGTTNSDELICVATASDIDEMVTPSLSYLWSNTTQSNTFATSDTLLLNSGMAVDGDVMVCMVTATDSHGGSVSASESLTITNTPPVITSLYISPINPDSHTSTLTCNALGSDADGDTVTFNYEWLVDSAPQSETSTMFSLNFIVGSIIACRATPTDGKETGVTEEDQVTVENTAPTVDSVTLSATTVYTNDSITATAVFSDIDATQTVTGIYEWHVVDASNGNTDSVVQSSSSNILDGATYFDRDDGIYVTVTPNDGVEDGTSVMSSSIAVSNSAPVMSSVTVTPDPAIAGTDDLTCDAVATDADGGDSIVYTYEWSDSSGVQQTMTEVSDMTDTFLTAGLSEDTWTCDVTPYDGTDYGALSSASVTVESGCSIGEYDCPGLTCKDVLDNNGSTGDGTYWIDPDGSGPFEAYCDMTTDGGGWTLCASASGNDQALRYGFIENGSASPTHQYSRDCSTDLETVGIEVLAENFSRNEIQLWSVYQNNLIYGTSYTGSDTSLSHIFDTQNTLSGNVLHGYCNHGNCIGYTNGYSIGNSIGNLSSQHFSLGGHCDFSCNERVIWYSSTVNDRVNLYIR